VAERPALRVGIDVGGTFTDVVAVDAATREIVARVKVPTTHAAADGVASGIVAGLRALLDDPRVDAARIAFVAHSTTQATNALLEGDVARVGIIGIAAARDVLGRHALAVPPIPLAPGRALAPGVAYAASGDEPALARAIATLVAGGAETLVASAPFGVDRPASERRAAACVREGGRLATAGHEVASTYGLRARTRTAALNAAILPRMLATARTTAGAVERAGIAVPLMIMRSDGGVMDVRDVARRPILTMLSGPAAGVSGALLHERVTDGIFMEVGGTSADCSAIRRGLPQLRPARVGGHRTMLRTLDVRTLAIAGGSLVRVDPTARRVLDVGPRSAHIAGLGYATFTEPLRFEGSRVVTTAAAGGEAAYAALELGDGARVAITPTCAANLLGVVPAGAFALGDAASARRAFSLVAEHLGIADAETLARDVLDRVTAKLRVAIDELAADYELDPATIELIGGGGGAAALVPYAAAKLGYAHRLARDAEVISPLGVALALVRESVERTIPNASADDVVRVRREAFDAVVAAGADPGLVEVAVDIDPRRNSIRATASGAAAAVAAGGAAAAQPATTQEQRAAAARAMRVDAEAVREVAAAGDFTAYAASRRTVPSGAFAKLRTRVEPVLAIVDRTGVVRALGTHAKARRGTVAILQSLLERALEDATAYGDVGRTLPEIALAYGSRFVTLGALVEAAHALALAAEETRGRASDEAILIVATPRRA